MASLTLTVFLIILSVSLGFSPPPPLHHSQNNYRHPARSLLLKQQQYESGVDPVHDTIASSDDGNTNTMQIMSSRRAMLAASASALLAMTTITPILSASAEPLEPSLASDAIFVKGTASLAPGLSTEELGSKAALYVTARPNRPDNVPRAILDGSRGKPPPVLSARFPNPTFPYEFTLTSQNFTPEGASIIEGGTSGDNIWWKGEDLIVSARFDSDGVAATRDPTDLVGRGLMMNKSSRDSVEIRLEGRGLFGKSVTSKK